MASSASSKDVAKVIVAHLKAPEASPDGLWQVIDGYLDKHASQDETGAERLQEQLLPVWEQHVRGDGSRYATFLEILRHLLPGLSQPGQIHTWVESLTGPIIDDAARARGQAPCWQPYLDLLSAIGNLDAVELREDVQQSLSLLMKRWLVAMQTETGQSSEQQYDALCHEALLLLAKKQCKLFFGLLDNYLVRKEYRQVTLGLVCNFTALQPSHMHTILDTQLLQDLIQCLQQDNDTTTVTTALTAVVMIMPNIASSLVPFLPLLFNVYARLLFWRQMEQGTPAAVLEDERQMSPRSSRWDVLGEETRRGNVGITNLQQYFTMLYGLYPINFSEYIRKPHRYLRHASSDTSDYVQSQASEIQQRSERFRRVHLLHPNFYSLTIDTEKTDFSRWLRSSTSDIVAECDALCLARDASSVTNREAEPLEAEPADRDSAALTRTTSFAYGAALLDRSISHEYVPGQLSGQHVRGADTAHEQSPLVMKRYKSFSGHTPSLPSLREAARSQDADGDSPTLPPQTSLRLFTTQLPDVGNKKKTLPYEAALNASIPSLSLSHHDATADKAGEGEMLHMRHAKSSKPRNALEIQLTELREQLLLTKNALQFERYMKQQHMNHIGELRRHQLKDAATEAETQSMIANNRTLKHRLEDSKRAETQAKKESENRRNLAKKWEADLSTKLRALKEEQKVWTSEKSELTRNLETKTEEYNKLVKMICDLETKELGMTQNVQAAEVQMAELDRLKGEVSRLLRAQQEQQTEAQTSEHKLAEGDTAVRKVHEMEMVLAAQEMHNRQTQAYYEKQIADLARKLQASRNGTTNSRGRGQENDVKISDVLAGSRAKQAELQQRYVALQQKYSAVQTSLLELTARTAPMISEKGSARDRDAQTSNVLQESAGMPIHLKRGFSDPEAVQGIAYNVTPPLEKLTGTSVDTVAHRPSSGSAGPSGANEVSPGNELTFGERIYGRGGVQNGIRGERKEKRREEKKEKKSGIRGMGRYI